MAKALLNFVANLLLLHSVLVNCNGLKIQITKSPRIEMFMSESNKSSSLHVQPRIETQVSYYIVKVGIGTFKSKPPYKEYYLDMDTGSSLVWLQCKGCSRCFKQTRKPFPKDNSSSYHPTGPYHVAYVDGSNSTGILAKETFYIKSSTGGMTKIENFDFGCGMENNMDYGDYKNNKISGIMGLGWGNRSFLNQINLQSNGKFSYCLPLASVKNPPPSYLRFGNDIDHVVQPKNSRMTTLLRVNNTDPYFVEMQGISLNGVRLNISTTAFELKQDGRYGGCVIDSGTSYSILITPAFLVLKLEVQKYFRKFKNLRKINGVGFEVCYERSKPEGFKNLPHLTFHFGGSNADFVMKPEAVFEVFNQFRIPRFREQFCLAMVRSNLRTIIGAHQQINQRIIFDTKEKQLVFHSEDCHKNP